MDGIVESQPRGLDHPKQREELKPITEESQSRLITEESLPVQGLKVGDRMRSSFSKPPSVLTNGEIDHKRSLTFTELEMQVRVIEQQNDQVLAQLDQLVVPDVPKVVDLESGSSLNTDKIYQTYGQLMSTITYNMSN